VHRESMASRSGEQTPTMWWLGGDVGKLPKGKLTKGVWGPRAWHWLHSKSVDYPENPSRQQKLSMLAEFWGFVQTLPCPTCRSHATIYARSFPPDLSGSRGFQIWAWRFHNAVNQRLGKPLMSAEKYQQTYREEISKKYWNYVG
jgi:FAD-linked sulfhydryl oxidase